MLVPVLPLLLLLPLVPPPPRTPPAAAPTMLLARGRPWFASTMEDDEDEDEVVGLVSTTAVMGAWPSNRIPPVALRGAPPVPGPKKGITPHPSLHPLSTPRNDTREAPIYPEPSPTSIGRTMSSPFGRGIVPGTTALAATAGPPAAPAGMIIFVLGPARPNDDDDEEEEEEPCLVRRGAADDDDEDEGTNS